MTETKGNYDESHATIESQKSIQKKDKKNNQLFDSFGGALADECKKGFYMVNFLRPDIYDDEGRYKVK